LIDFICLIEGHSPAGAEHQRTQQQNATGAAGAAARFFGKRNS